MKPDEIKLYHTVFFLLQFPSLIFCEVANDKIIMDKRDTPPPPKKKKKKKDLEGLIPDLLSYIGIGLLE